MIEPAQFDPKRTSSMRWNGRDWPLPDMPPLQLQMVWDDMKVVSRALGATERVIAEQTPPETQSSGLRVISAVYDLTSDEYGKLRDIVFYGLQVAHPTLDREEFNAVPSTPVEMLLAFFKVRTQSRMYDMSLSSAGASPPGEALATENLRTGTTS